jgi:hypothetical protein
MIDAHARYPESQKKRSASPSGINRSAQKRIVSSQVCYKDKEQEIEQTLPNEFIHIADLKIRQQPSGLAKKQTPTCSGECGS